MPTKDTKESMQCMANKKISHSLIRFINVENFFKKFPLI